MRLWRAKRRQTANTKIAPNAIAGHKRKFLLGYCYYEQKKGYRDDQFGHYGSLLGYHQKLIIIVSLTLGTVDPQC
jgi:hypothetical protein